MVLLENDSVSYYGMFRLLIELWDWFGMGVFRGVFCVVNFNELLNYSMLYLSNAWCFCELKISVLNVSDF